MFKNWFNLLQDISTYKNIERIIRLQILKIIGNDQLSIPTSYSFCFLILSLYNIQLFSSSTFVTTKILKVVDESRTETHLTELHEGPEIDRPGSEEKLEDVGHRQPGKHNQGVGEVKTRHDEQQPERVYDGERPDVKSPRPVPPSEQVHPLHHLPVHIESRHSSSGAPIWPIRRRGIERGLDRRDGRDGGGKPDLGKLRFGFCEVRLMRR